jgi:hypothetical protein
VGQGVLCWSYEAVHQWQRCDILSPSYCYCPNVDLTDSLDRLSELAVNLFSPILNRGQAPLPSIHDHPFGPDEKGVRFALTTHLCYSLYQLGP